MRLGLFVHRLVGHRIIVGRWSDGERASWCRNCEPDYYDWHRAGRTFIATRGPGLVARVEDGPPAVPARRPAAPAKRSRGSGKVRTAARSKRASGSGSMHTARGTATLPSERRAPGSRGRGAPTRLDGGPVRQASRPARPSVTIPNGHLAGAAVRTDAAGPPAHQARLRRPADAGPEAPFLPSSLEEPTNDRIAMTG